jgi:3'(2'), 5'-bisphosphate nucleotidase
MLSHAFPNDPIVAEEDATEIRQGSSKSLCDRIVQLANEALTGELQLGDNPAWGIGPGKAKSTEEVLDAIDKGNHSGGRVGS